MIKCKNGGNIEILFGTGASSMKDYEGLYCMIKTCFESGIRGFDTAPSYGIEEVLGKCLVQCMKDFEVSREEFFVQTKIDTWQMTEGKNKIKGFVESAIENMGIDYLDALLIHWPVPEYFDETWECFAELQQEGLMRNIVICNLRMRQLEKILDYEVKPKMIQIERNPLRTCEREVGFCHDHGINIQSYSPLCKMHEYIRTSEVLKIIAEKYDKNIGQIVLRWQMDTGVIPIFTSKKTSRVKEYSELSDFSLNSDEIRAVNNLNRDYKMYLESCACPGFET